MWFAQLDHPRDVVAVIGADHSGPSNTAVHLQGAPQRPVAKRPNLRALSGATACWTALSLDLAAHCTEIGIGRLRSSLPGCGAAQVIKCIPVGTVLYQKAGNDDILHCNRDV